MHHKSNRIFRLSNVGFAFAAQLYRNACADCPRHVSFLLNQLQDKLLLLVLPKRKLLIGNYHYKTENANSENPKRHSICELDIALHHAKNIQSNADQKNYNGEYMPQVILLLLLVLPLLLFLQNIEIVDHNPDIKYLKQTAQYKQREAQGSYKLQLAHAGRTHHIIVTAAAVKI